jgi:hypothetical protein
LVRIFVLLMRMHQPIALLQHRRRFYLIHQTVFTLEGLTHRASHIGLHCLPVLEPVKIGFRVRVMVCAVAMQCVF